MKGSRRLIEILLRRIFLGKKFLGPRRVYFCELKRRLRGREIAFGLRDRCLKQSRINLRDGLASFHL